MKGLTSAVGFPRRSLWHDVVHAAILHAFAVAQPALELLGRRDAFVIDSGGTPTGLVFVAVLLLAGGPLILALALWSCEWFGRSLRDMAHACIVFSLITLFALPLYRIHSLLTGEAIVFAALATAATATWLYFHSARVRSVVSFAACGAPIFPILFLYQSPAGRSVMLPPPATARSAHPVPVVIVTFDEFSGLSLRNPDHTLNDQRFPRLAELSRRSTWYRNATAVHAETVCALPALLTGRYPGKEGRYGRSRDEQNLFNLVMRSGKYEMIAFEPVSRLAIPGDAVADWQKPGIVRQAARMLPEVAKAFLLNLTPPELRRGLPPLSSVWWGVPAEGPTDRTARNGVVRWGWSCRRVEQFSHFLDCIQPRERPALHFLHLVFPHVPWMYLPSGRAYADECGDLSLLNFNTEGSLPDYWCEDADFVTRQQQRYLLQAVLADRMIGQLIDQLDSTGLWDECLLVVTADHGVSFRPGLNRRYLSGNNADEILSVPLFVKLPGQRKGRLDDHAAESVDILPTVAEVLGIPLTEPLDGRSLLIDARSDRTEVNFVEEQTKKSFPLATVAASQTPRIAEATFGQTPGDLFRIGPYPGLIGRRVDSLMVVEDRQQTRLDLTRGGSRVDVSGTGRLPCYFEGIYRGNDLDNPPPIAIAIDGVIAAVTRPSHHPEIRGRWDALVAEEFLPQGSHSVDYYSVISRAAEPVLSRCPTQQAVFRVLPLE